MWRRDPNESLIDYRMTRLIFGVLASFFAANMAVRQNIIDHARTFPQAAQAILESFYVDDGLVGSDSLQEAIQLWERLQQLFGKVGFVLRKWKSSHLVALEQIPSDLLDQQLC